MSHQCPKCGSDELLITVKRDVRVRFDEDDEHEVLDETGDTEWDDDSDVSCGDGDCDFSGKLKECE